MKNRCSWMLWWPRLVECALDDPLEGAAMTEPGNNSPQADDSSRPSQRRILLTMLGGISLAFCSYVAFFSFEHQGVVESVAMVTYGSLFFAGVILFLGGCVQAIRLFYRKLKGSP